MAEPLKNSFGPNVVASIGADIAAVYPTFDLDRFLTVALDGFDELELTPRARQVAEALAPTLPSDHTEAMKILQASLGSVRPETMEGFRYLPHSYFVAEHGLDDFETAMSLQEDITKQFTSEFSIRAFYEHHPEATLARARVWAADEDEHLRRLASEGCRPRLPWAGRLQRFIDDPTEVIELLELLRADDSEYVRRSVANNLNDIAKDHPGVVVEVTRRWMHEAAGTTAEVTRRSMVRHALRTLIKAGDLDALNVLGFGPESPAELQSASVTPETVAIGGKVKVELMVANASAEPAGALVDVIVHFVKADGSTSPKVFKGKELTVDPGGSAVVNKTISLAQHSTRKHYVGEHQLEIQLNGAAMPGPAFTLIDSSDSSS